MLPKRRRKKIREKKWGKSVNRMLSTDLNKQKLKKNFFILFFFIQQFLSKMAMYTKYVNLIYCRTTTSLRHPDTFFESIGHDMVMTYYMTKKFCPISYYA